MNIFYQLRASGHATMFVSPNKDAAQGSANRCAVSFDLEEVVGSASADHRLACSWAWVELQALGMVSKALKRWVPFSDSQCVL